MTKISNKYIAENGTITKVTTTNTFTKKEVVCVCSSNEVVEEATNLLNKFTNGDN